MQNGDGAHIQVAAEVLQAAVQRDGHQALSALHDKGRNAKPGNAGHHLAIGAQVGPADVQAGFRPGEKAQHPRGADRLAENGGEGRALHPKPQPEDEDRVQHQVQHRADEHAQHGHGGLPLSRDEGIQAQGKLHEHGAPQIDADVIQRIADGSIRGAEGVQKRALARLKQHGEQHAERRQHGDTAAQNLLGAVPVTLAQLDGGQRCAALPGKGGEGGNQHQNGGAHPHAGEGCGPDAGNVADVNAVHYIIKHVDELGGHGGQRQLKHKLADGGRTHALFFCRCSRHGQASLEAETSSPASSSAARRQAHRLVL